MTAAQFLGMYAAPFLIVPASGLNTVIQVKQVLYEVEYGGAQFAGGGVVNAGTTTSAGGAITGAGLIRTILSGTAGGNAGNTGYNFINNSMFPSICTSGTGGALIHQLALAG